MTEKTPKTKNTGSNGKTNQKGKKRSAAMITLCVLLCVLGILIAVAVVVWNHTKPDPMSGQKPNFDITEEETENMGQDMEETVDESAPTVDQEMLEETLPTVEEIEIPKDEGWTHYLLLGIDNTSYKSGRSDAMIVFSVHKEEQKLVLSSVPRDTLVYIEGKGFDKLTNAYSYGGADLTVKTFSQNFDVDVANYFIVNFQSLPEIVDLVGGVTLTLTDAEAEHMGRQYAAWGLSGGTQKLNGKEVLAYCRVRKIDSDYKRNERQYKALMAIYNEVKTLSYDKYIALAKVAYDNMYSDMKMGDMLLLVKDVMEIADGSEIEHARLVGGDNSKAGRINVNGVNTSVVLVNDLAEAAVEWREQLGIDGYEPSARLEQISQQLDKVVGRE